MERKPYIVQPGHSVRAGGKSHRDGATVQLTDADGKRLAAQGAVVPAKAADKAPSILDGSVAEVVAALAGVAPEELAALFQAETEGKARKGVLDAIKAAAKAPGAE